MSETKCRHPPTRARRAVGNGIHFYTTKRASQRLTPHTKPPYKGGDSNLYHRSGEKTRVIPQPGPGPPTKKTKIGTNLGGAAATSLCRKMAPWTWDKPVPGERKATLGGWQFRRVSLEHQDGNGVVRWPTPRKGQPQKSRPM